MSRHALRSAEGCRTLINGRRVAAKKTDINRMPPNSTTSFGILIGGSNAPCVRYQHLHSPIELGSHPSIQKVFEFIGG